MASKNLTFNFFGKDKTASTTMNNLGTNAIAAGKKVALAAAAMAAAIAVVVVRFGIDSVKAAAEAETAQLKLTDAWAKFPKTADLAISALREYNEELAKKTRFDDDSIASGQAVLAQFNLTGKQIQKLTPLLLDYAAKTGKDLPTAATDLGKALLGQGRALKALGIEFVDTGTTAGNFEQLMGALSAQVGGFAEKEGTTAAGKLEILKNRFGEVQEAIGFALIPVLDDLLTITNDRVLPMLEDFSGWFKDEGLPNLRDFVGWVVQYKDILGPTAVALGVLTAAQWLLNAAMFANPIGLVILALATVIGYVAALATNFMGLRDTVVGVNGAIAVGLAKMALGVSKAIEGAVNAVIGGINTMIDAVNGLLSAIGLTKIPKLGNVNFTSGLAGQINGLQQSLVQGSGYKASGSSGTNKAGNAGRFAEGGIVPARPGGWTATVGEGGQDEAIIPLDRLGRMGGGDTYNIIVPGGYVGDENKLAQKLARLVDNAKSRGAIPRTAFSS